MSNTIPFPSVPKPNVEPEIPGDKNTQQYGRGHRPRKAKGTYKDINEGLIAAIAISEDQTDVDDPVAEIVNDKQGVYFNQYYDFPPDLAMLGQCESNPKTLDEALHGPNAKEWQEALDYEISQLKKLGTWVVESLPHGETVIPCSEVVKIK